MTRTERPDRSTGVCAGTGPPSHAARAPAPRPAARLPGRRARPCEPRPMAVLDVLDWRRRVREAYAEVRAEDDPAAGARPVARRARRAVRRPPGQPAVARGAGVVHGPAGRAVRPGLPLRGRRAPRRAAPDGGADRDRRRRAVRAGRRRRAAGPRARWTCGGWPRTAAGCSCRCATGSAAARAGRSAAAGTCWTRSRARTSAATATGSSSTSTSPTTRRAPTTPRGRARSRPGGNTVTAEVPVGELMPEDGWA